MRSLRLVLLALCCFAANVRPLRAAPAITIAEGARSAFRIVTPRDAPSSVQAAARELQKDVELASGAKLPLVTDDATVSTPFISVGSTTQAKKAGISFWGVADEGFRIRTQDGNIFILGPDTPDGGHTTDGGTSNGTANGVYTFLEDYLGVRWLFPGDLGRDVPRQSTLRVSAIDRSEAPFLINRRQPYMQNNKPAVQQWEDRQKLGYSFRIEHGHNWTRTITPAYYETHPEWFAMIDGKRVPPKGHYKLETTDPKVVRFFADKAVATLQANPAQNTFSLSPSDGRGWSESPESKAFYDPIPPGHTHPSTTPLILKFYRDVAEIVTRELPDAKLAGYIYADYLYPPTKGGMTLPKNFYPVIAPSIDYGYKLYRPDVQHDFNALLAEWSKVTPHLFFYDLPTRIRENSGLLTPTAPEILNFIFPRLVKNNVQGVYIYGIDSWSQAAVSNYVLAKMMWNPHLNAVSVQREWLQRAYGPKAGTRMERLYQKLDGWFREYYRDHHEASYRLTDAMFKGIYGAHYPELEKLFLQAKAQPMSEMQQQRLQLIEDNLIVLQWRLKNSNLLAPGFRSGLAVSDARVAKILTAEHADFDYFPGMSLQSGAVAAKIKKVQLSPTLPAGKSSFPLPDRTTFLIYAARDGQIRITPRLVNHADWFAAYSLKRAPNETIAAGLLVQDQPIEFAARAGEEYSLHLAPHTNIGYELQIAGATVAKGRFDAATGVLTLRDEGAPVYVYGDEKSVFDETGGALITTASSLSTLRRKFRNVQVLNLDEKWRFLPAAATGQPVWESNFDDGDWTELNTGNWWQRQGFPDYHGPAWYRKVFDAPALEAGRRAMLHFGGVDGSAVVYINGQKLGSHLVGPDYSGWNEPFSFDVTKVLRPGENTLAVQVTSKSLDTASGINESVNLLIGEEAM